MVLRPFLAREILDMATGRKWFEEGKDSELLSGLDISQALLGHQNDVSPTQHTSLERVLCAPWFSAGCGETNSNDVDPDLKDHVV